MKHEVRIADDLIEGALLEQVRLVQRKGSCMPCQPADITELNMLSGQDRR